MLRWIRANLPESQTEDLGPCQSDPPMRTLGTADGRLSRSTSRTTLTVDFTACVTPSDLEAIPVSGMDCQLK
jgi:hypothetical protein